jgi:5-methyltetrahydrofolate--homocysteine methyltransferase
MSGKGKILLATVKGDVHDIGKNIVGVVLQCNGYEVIDLGVMVPAQKILDMARSEEVDVIGLSGLITPSLDEMVFLASEMERQGVELPLLIGGATTSKVHTAIKIDPERAGAVIHVVDASRAVGVVGKLISDTLRPEFIQSVAEDLEAVRVRRANRSKGGRRVSLELARKNRRQIDFTAHPPVPPQQPGLHTFELSISELRPYIDWTPFFHAWEMKGRYPAILEHEKMGEQARILLAEAKEMLDQIEAESWIQPKAVVGLFPANTVGDDIAVYADESRSELAGTIHCLRQQGAKSGTQSNLSLADFVAPRGVADWVGAFCVTAGGGVAERAHAFQAVNDDYRSILLKSIADRLAEASAEFIHQRVRMSLWGTQIDETLDQTALIAESYSGIRPAPGYPACPDHTAKRFLFELVDATTHTGVELTESMAMLPAASVSGWMFGHPASMYFGVGRIEKDQVKDYARRCGLALEIVERWLSPSLAYER